MIFAWETGARAAECLAIEKRHVDLPAHRIVFPVEEEKMQRMPRIIYLTDAAEEIVRRLVLRHPSGPIFRNTNGAAWTTEAVNCAFVALQIRIGLRAMKEEGFTLSEEEIQRKIATLKPDRKAKRKKRSENRGGTSGGSEEKAPQRRRMPAGEEALPDRVSPFVLPSPVEIRGRCPDRLGSDGTCGPDA